MSTTIGLDPCDVKRLRGYLNVEENVIKGLLIDDYAVKRQSEPLLRLLRHAQRQRELRALRAERRPGVRPELCAAPLLTDESASASRSVAIN
jgi:hypothetical protein